MPGTCKRRLIPQLRINRRATSSKARNTLRRIDDDCIPFEYEADGVAHDCDDHHCDASGLVLVGQSAASEPWTGTLADQEHRQKSSLDYTPLKFEYREKGTVFLLTIPKGDYHSLPATSAA